MQFTDQTWSRPEAWRQAQLGLDLTLHRLGGKAQGLFKQALDIQGLLISLDQDLEELCSRTCPWCADPCCKRAEVRYDFRDLLFLHCQQLALPLGQPRSKANQPCALLARQGCRLPRILRPFMCTWYLCPRQMGLVRESVRKRQRALPTQLQLIQDKRKELESSFFDLLQL
ncbi:MAG: hypothetical protein ACLFRL_07100 [Desulfohalobiaceae bacterium]